MALFLTGAERGLVAASADPVMQDYQWALASRAARLASSPGLMNGATTTEWWHVAMEYVSSVAMAYALKPDAAVGGWLRGTTLDIVRRSADDWVGPAFRGHGGGQPCGNLETAHLSWACSLALDLAGPAFSGAERDEVRTVLRERAIPMCRRFLDSGRSLSNWRCILLAGAAVPAAVLGDAGTLEACAEEWKRTVQCFQEDGSYGESLQYGHYAMYGLILAYEAIHRASPGLAAGLDVGRYARGMRWHAASLLYRKPLGGAWGEHPRPRAVNFNDSAAVFAPSPDVLLHIAVRCAGSLPVEAGLARWMVDRFWPPVPDLEPHDRASLGMVTHWGFLCLPLLPQAPPAMGPEGAGMDALFAASNGDAIARDRWDGATVLAVRGGGDPLCVHGHLHADLNSLVLVHRRERMLADPGHSCYRGLLRRIECATDCHNTCTFAFEEAGRTRHLDQGLQMPPRELVDGVPGPRVDRGARRLVAARRGEVSVIGSEAAAAYGEPLRRFARFTWLAGSHAVFVVDHIVSAVPVETTWNWILNNRANALEIKLFADRVVARRGDVGMKLFHCAHGRRSPIAHGWLHEAYHPLPNQLGEGASGSATVLRFHEDGRSTERWAVHAIAVDGYGGVAGWHLREAPGAGAILESPGGGVSWQLAVNGDAREVVLMETRSGRRWRLFDGGGDAWVLEGGEGGVL